MHLAAESFQIEARLGGDPLRADVDNISWIMRTLLTETVQALQKFHITINHNLQQPHLWTDNDSFIMEAVSSLHIFTAKEMHWINEVRLHLQVMTFSDLFTVDGRFVWIECYKGRRVFLCSGKAYAWPNAATPTKSSLRTWQRALRIVFYLKDDSMHVKDHMISSWQSISTHYFQWLFDESNWWLL